MYVVCGGTFAFYLVGENHFHHFQILFLITSSLFFMHDMYMMNKEEKGDGLELYRFFFAALTGQKLQNFFHCSFFTYIQ